MFNIHTFHLVIIRSKKGWLGEKEKEPVLPEILCTSMDYWVITSLSALPNPSPQVQREMFTMERLRFPHGARGRTQGPFKMLELQLDRHSDCPWSQIDVHSA